MNTECSDTMPPANVRRCFLPAVEFISVGRQLPTDKAFVVIAPLSQARPEPEALNDGNLPMLALPDDLSKKADQVGRIALVAVEGRDRRMADALGGLLDPANVGIGLMHVTWLPRTISSPLDPGGLNNPESADLLAFEGAREALIETASNLRQLGFEVSTHLREHRDPAMPLANTIRQQGPDLFVLGLGRHGAGIGQRVLETIQVPVLYLNAR